LKNNPLGRKILCLLTLSLATLVSRPIYPQSLTSAQPSSFAAIDAIMEEAIARRDIPGGVVLIGHNGKVIYRKAYGWRSIEPAREVMTADTVFDLASLTKCIATTSSVMKLVQEGRVRLNDPVATYLPEFAQNDKGEITVRELLTHFSGLSPDLDLKEPWQGRSVAFSMAMQEKPAFPPGSRFVYSDINFETLGFLVEKVSGVALNVYVSANIFAPLGMNETRYLPPSEWLPRIAPTQYDEQGKMLRGVVHDPTARRMGGVAGHAGLFSTADDLAKFAQELLTGEKVLSRSIVEKMTTPQQPATAPSLRGLGWDIDSPFASNRGELLPVGSFGHTGFTGTSLWIDPVTNTYIIILTNQVHPNGHGSVVSLRARIATTIAASLELTASESDRLRSASITGYNESMMAGRSLTVRNGEVKAGIDVLEAHGYSELHPDPNNPVRIGLVTNHTALDAHGQRTADILAHAPGLQLAAIFSPEHGVAGVLDTTEIGNSKDEVTGAPIFSVYGDTDAKRRPRESQIAGVDAIVFDITDIGARFYTYESTLGYFLEAGCTRSPKSDRGHCRAGAHRRLGT
jgi:CubicO group peptidase (beta-lactamase class C family)